MNKDPFSLNSEILSEVISTAGLGFCVTDSEGIIVSANPELLVMLGIHESELYGNTPDYLFGVKEGVFAYNSLWFEISNFPAKGEEGCFEVFLFSDITDRKDIEQKLELAEKRVQVLGTDTRHDVINQLVTVRGILGLLKLKVKDEKLTELVMTADRAAEYINSLIEFSRDYEKIGSDEPVWQDLKALVSMTYAMGKCNGVNFSQENTDYEIFSDPQLKKAFYNLIENSIRHGGDVSEIKVSAFEKDGVLTVVYEDNGEGVEPEDRTKIFKKGFGKDAGVGLVLVREVLAVTGIEIHETGETGKGTRFEISVPSGMYRPV